MAEEAFFKWAKDMGLPSVAVYELVDQGFDVVVIVVNLVQCQVHRSGTDNKTRGERELISNRYTVTMLQNDFRIAMGSDVSHFSVSLIVQGKVTRQCP